MARGGARIGAGRGRIHREGYIKTRSVSEKVPKAVLDRLSAAYADKDWVAAEKVIQELLMYFNKNGTLI
jgi:hypothetical protein